MKRIELAFPFEAIRGLLGSKQDLRYAENDNKAFESPAGKVNYARNYEPRLVGAKVARTGLKYFAVKTKAAFKNTAQALKQCALMGATSAIYGISIANATLKAQLEAAFALAVAAGYEGTFHKWVTNNIRVKLANNAPTIVIAIGAVSVNLGNNPYSDAETAIAITSKMLVKFWNQLKVDGATFYVGNAKAIAVEDSDFDFVCGTERINVLGLTLQTIGQEQYVKLGSQYLLDESLTYVTNGSMIYNNNRYTLTDTAPQA